MYRGDLSYICLNINCLDLCFFYLFFTFLIFRIMEAQKNVHVKSKFGDFEYCDARVRQEYEK